VSDDTSIVVQQMDLSPKGAMRQATDVAGVCREIVMKTAQNIQGRKYVRVEGWLAMARAFGCTVGTRDVEKVEGGIRAMADVRRITDGAVIATAEGFVGEDEKMWAGRPVYARRAMAQTRAVSRACRSAFAFVVVMIDEGLSTTPAEEMGADDRAPEQTVHATEHGSEDIVAARRHQWLEAKTATQRALALKGLTPEQSKMVVGEGAA
jgi:hypothetical protein